MTKIFKSGANILRNSFSRMMGMSAGHSAPTASSQMAGGAIHPLYPGTPPEPHHPWRANSHRMQCQVRALEVFFDYNDEAQKASAEGRRRSTYARFKRLSKIMDPRCELKWEVDEWRKKYGNKLPPILRFLITSPDARGVQRRRLSVMKLVPGRWLKAKQEKDAAAFNIQNQAIPSSTYTWNGTGGYTIGSGQYAANNAYQNPIPIYIPAQGLWQNFPVGQLGQQGPFVCGRGKASCICGQCP